jgi:hypothetical protein
VSGRSAGWETRDTADWEVCGTPAVVWRRKANRPCFEIAKGLLPSVFAALRLKENFPRRLPLTPRETARDALCRKMIEAPADFREFQAWSIRTHNPAHINAQALYGREYDQIVSQSRGGVRP